MQPMSTEESTNLVSSTSHHNRKEDEGCCDRQWTTVQLIVIVFFVAFFVGFFSNLDRIIDELSSGDPNKPPEPIATKNITEIIADREDLVDFYSILGTSNVAATLNGYGPFTVFAVTNNGFNNLSDSIFNQYFGTTDALSVLVNYHIVSGKVLSSELWNGQIIDTLNGDSITSFLTYFLYGSNGSESVIIEPEIIATNGIIHIIDDFMIPNGTIANFLKNIQNEGVPFLSKLYELIVENGLDAAFADPDASLTLFAPTNDAIDAFPKNLTTEFLLHHVINQTFTTPQEDDDTIYQYGFSTMDGNDISVRYYERGMNVTDYMGRTAHAIVYNIECSNGVIHVIDQVLAPSEFLSIVDILTSRPELSSLVDALTATGLIEALKGDGPFTILAPDNDAIAALSSNITTDVLLYHVIAENVFAYDIINGNISSGTMYDTLNGQTVSVYAEEYFGTDIVYFYDSFGRRSQTLQVDAIGQYRLDIVASNGVIHIMDSVLLPDGTVWDVTENIPDLQYLHALLDDPTQGFEQHLSDPNDTFTLFAPTNSAFDEWGDRWNETLEPLGNVLLYHVVNEEYIGYDFPNDINGTTLETLQNGTTVTVYNTTGFYPVKPEAEGLFCFDQDARVANVIKMNIAASNGVVHWVDRVMTSVSHPTNAPSSDPSTNPTSNPTSTPSANPSSSPLAI